MQPVDADLTEVMERELALLDPAVRRDPARVGALLHPDFVEFGASGRVWDQASLATMTSGATAPIAASDLRGRRVGPDAVLLTYRSSTEGRQTLRSSMWVRGQSTEWLLLFHQGTPCG